MPQCSPPVAATKSERDGGQGSSRHQGGAPPSVLPPAKGRYSFQPVCDSTYDNLATFGEPVKLHNHPLLRILVRPLFEGYFIIPGPGSARGATGRTGFVPVLEFG